MEMSEAYSSKAIQCVSHVRRTLFLTFLLVFITLAFMYGTTENMTTSSLAVIQSNFRPISVVRQRLLNHTAFYSKPLGTGELNYGRNLLNISIGKNGTTSLPESVEMSDRKPISGTRNLDISKLRPAVVKHPDEYLFQGLPAKWSGLIPLKPGEQESPEFPGMPDPCMAPRRVTGVEDVLCMDRPKFLPHYKNPCWTDEGGVFRCLPYFHLIGTCKSGTSDFFKRLLKHPDIVPNKGIFGKEIWYWSWKRFPDQRKQSKKGMTLKQFTEQFQTGIIKTEVDGNGYHNKITGHGDPMDIWDRHKEGQTPQNNPLDEEHLWTTPYAVRHINPSVKLLLMLRDPVERLYSHYFHAGYGTSAQSFHDDVVQAVKSWNACLNAHTIRHCIYDQTLMKTLSAPLHTSFYVIHLREWLKVFPREQIYIFRNEDYSKDIKGTIADMCTFLNITIPSKTNLEEMSKQPHFYVTKKKSAAGPMKPETKQILVDLYRPYVNELARILNDERFAFKDGSFG